MKSKKQGMQLPFAWIFASLVGAFILFLAIFASVKIIKTGETKEDLTLGKEIGILLNPLETGFESGKTTFIVLPRETRIYGECVNTGQFGEQRIRISQLSFNEWTETTSRVAFQNKYIFSERYAEGKKFHIFSKPFEMPFKIADLIYLTSSRDIYCFVDAPERINNELKSLGQENIQIKNCSENAIKICFLQRDCEIGVEESLGIVAKGSDRLYFKGDALMYAAIFSEPKAYGCQLKRLAQRIEHLSLLYRDKATLVSRKECNSNLNLAFLAEFSRNFENSEDIKMLGDVADEIKRNNEIAICKLW